MNLIAKIGQDPDFIAFNAHWGFAYFVLHFWLSRYPAEHWSIIAVALVLAAVKEFWFDIRYETAQTWQDGALDFFGYAVGIMLAQWC
jgi:hypothetical protein